MAVLEREGSTTLLQLNVDGSFLKPMMRKNATAFVAAFIIPEDANDLRIVSSTWSPKDGDPRSTDDRRLGVMIQSIVIDDLLGNATEVPLDHRGLLSGFHQIERTDNLAWRWTDGNARLSDELWMNCVNKFVLRLAGEFSSNRP